GKETAIGTEGGASPASCTPAVSPQSRSSRQLLRTPRADRAHSQPDGNRGALEQAENSRVLSGLVPDRAVQEATACIPGFAFSPQGGFSALPLFWMSWNGWSRM